VDARLGCRQRGRRATVIYGFAASVIILKVIDWTMACASLKNRSARPGHLPSGEHVEYAVHVAGSLCSQPMPAQPAVRAP